MSKHSIDLLFQACRAIPPLELLVTDTRIQKRARWALEHPFAILGRSPEADLTIKDSSVSWRHAYLQVVDGRVLCIDLESREGTFKGDQRIDTAWLFEGDEIRVGPFLVQLVTATPSEDAPALNGVDPLDVLVGSSHDLPLAKLEILNSTTRQAPWQMSRRLALVGRSGRCQIRLRASGAPRFHCSLLCTSLGLWVIDLQTPEGIGVNGARVRFAQLEQGDRLQVGHRLFGVHCQGPRNSTPVTPTASIPPRALAVVAAQQALARSTIPVLPVTVRPPETSLAQSQRNGMGPPGLTTEMKGLLESFLLPLFRQMVVMQQQSFDQFRQAMVQSIQVLNQNQLSFVRQEFHRLSQLTAEMEELRRQLAAVQQNQPGKPLPVAAQPRQTETLGLEQQKAPTPAASPPAAAAPAPSPRVHRPAQEQVHEAHATAQEASPPPQNATKEEMHDWLTRRIAQVQNEQSGAWDRVRRFFFGARSQI